MAVTKASSQRMAASQVTKKPLNDLMDAIKEASTQGSKKPDFKNFLAAPIAAKMVDSDSVKVTNKIDLPRKEPNTIKSEPLDSETPSRQSDLESSPLDVDIDLDECRSVDQQESHQNNLGYMTTIQADTPELTSSKTDPLRIASMKEEDIQGWINQGRVKIELVEQTNPNSVTDQSSVLATQTAYGANHIQDHGEQKQIQRQDNALNFNEADDFTETLGHSTSSHPLEHSPVIQQQQAPMAPPIVAPTELQNTQKSPQQQNLSDLKVNATSTSSVKGTKAATLTTLDKLNALNQIKEQLKQSLQKGETHLKIQLKPHEMGKVDIKLDISREGAVTAAFKAENRETLETLIRHAVDFQNLFKDAGLQTDSQGMNFSMNQENHPDQQSFEAAVYSEDLPSLEEVKVTTSGLLSSSQINILT
ncbi:MAG: flagellar hook-length control protein FliK [Candidatus Paracaedibacteraceae bacterium]|nr:flagellar hook-length control protein FliK [Candidatus Paracaedibacteraceae bacterium]